MYARVTLVEIDAVRHDIDLVVEKFEELVVPELREQEGYAGVLAMTTPEGKGLVMSLWDTEEAADAELGFYNVQLEKFMTMFKAPPGRERYEVVFAEAPALAAR